MIDELVQIDVNGDKQWVLTRSNQSDKPIILFVHGGPASPLMLFSRALDAPFLKHFIITHWDQRLSGKSYNSETPISSFTLDQIVKDGLVVTSYLKRKFKSSQIILVGHSWGSIIAAHMVRQSPKDFSIFLSVGTVVDMRKGDELKYKFLKEKVATSGEQEDKKDLEEMGAPPWKEFPQLVKHSRLMTKFKGSFFSLTSSQLNEAVNKSKEYTQKELENLDISMEKVWKQIFPFLSSYVAGKHITKLDTRVVFVQGLHDMATPTTLAKEYYDKLVTTQGKKWIEFKNSAHFPMYEEPEVFLKVLLENTK